MFVPNNRLGYPPKEEFQFVGQIYIIDIYSDCKFDI